MKDRGPCLRSLDVVTEDTTKIGVTEENPSKDGG